MDNKKKYTQMLALTTVIAFLDYVYLNFFSTNAIGIIIVYLVFIANMATIFFNLKKGFLFAIATALLFPAHHRSVFFIDIADEVVDFYSIFTVKLVSFSLMQLIFLFLLTKSLYLLFLEKVVEKKQKLRNIPFDKILFAYLLVYLLIVTGSIITAIFYHGEFDIRQFVGDQNQFIIVFMSYAVLQIIVKSLKDLDNIFFFLLSVTVIIGIRSILLIATDVLNGVINLNFYCNQYISIPILFSFLIFMKQLKISLLIKSLIIFLIITASIDAGRTTMILIFLSFIGYMIVSIAQKSDFKVKVAVFVRLLVSIVMVIGSFLFAIFMFNEKLFGFFIYKFSFFSNEVASDEISSSPLVRVFEFKNIYSEELQNPIRFLIGKGFGGAFTYKIFPIPFELFESDYSKEELASNVFFKPHEFINFCLLKGGVIYLGFTIYLFYFAVVNGFKFLQQLYKSPDKTGFQALVFCFFAAFFLINSYWLPALSIVLGFCLFAISFYKNMDKSFVHLQPENT